MKIIDDYKKIECISKMKKDYQDAFYDMVNEYAEQLSDRICAGGSAYTLHDFSAHCVNLYKIISNVIFDKDIAYGAGTGLTEWELYILNLSVLFHDIGMSRVIEMERDNHSQCSAEYIQELYNNTQSALRKKASLEQNDVYALCDIIKAHSSVKSLPPEERGLNGVRETMPGKEEIRAKLLAGILRIADELDITSSRVGAGEIETELEKVQKDLIRMEKIDDNEEQINKKKKLVESLEYWKKLHYFSEVKRKKESGTIKIILDDRKLKLLFEEGQVEDKIAGDICENIIKIRKELLYFRNNSLSKVQFEAITPIKSVEYITTIDGLNEKIEMKLEEKSFQSDVSVTELLESPCKEDKKKRP